MISKATVKLLTVSFVVVAVVTIPVLALLTPQNSEHRNPPKTHEELMNPYTGQPEAGKAGGRLFAIKCARCHGPKGEGTLNVPALAGAMRSIPEGVIFSYITRGDVNNGMPSWASLPERQRWQIVTYLKSLPNPPAAK